MNERGIELAEKSGVFGGSPVVGAIVTIVILGCVIACAFIFLPGLIKKLMELGKDAKEELVPEEVDPINAALANMNKTMGLMLRRGDKAQTLAAEVELQTMILVQMIQGFVYKVGDFAIEREALVNAMAAVSTGDPIKIAEAAGGVKDQALSVALLTDLSDPQIRNSVQRVLAHEVGSIRQWEQTYITFSARLLDDVAQTRGRLHNIKASLELLQVAEPVVTIEGNLMQATKLLQVAREPEQAKLLRTSGGGISSRLLLG